MSLYFSISLAKHPFLTKTADIRGREQQKLVLNNKLCTFD